MKSYNISSAIHKILGFQSVFRPALRFGPFRQMSSISAIDPNITRINKYWFDTDNPRQKWFQGGAQVDAEIKSQFSELIAEGRASKLTSWTQQPQGTLALLLLLDQFPRNVFRGTADAFSSDAMALDVAVNAIAKEQHKELAPLKQIFFHLPFTHDERLISQVAGVALCEAMIARNDSGSDAMNMAEASLASAKKHLAVIQRFGRFPARNAALGRDSTVEEVEFLKDHPFGL